MASFPFVAANTLTQQSVTFRDAKGNTGKFQFFMDLSVGTLNQAQTDVETVLNAAAALSNAAVQKWTGFVTEYGVAQYGAHNANGAYESINEKAQFVFQDVAGQLHRYEIPAPKIAIFKSDKITVDPANALVITFVNAMTQAGASGGNFVKTRQNLELANYMGGVFRGRKIRRRLNVLILEPDLTPSLPAE
jgi:hypothetical protein